MSILYSFQIHYLSQIHFLRCHGLMQNNSLKVIYLGFGDYFLEKMWCCPVHLDRCLLGVNHSFFQSYYPEPYSIARMSSYPRTTATLEVLNSSSHWSCSKGHLHQILTFFPILMSLQLNQCKPTYQYCFINCLYSY